MKVHIYALINQHACARHTHAKQRSLPQIMANTADFMRFCCSK